MFSSTDLTGQFRSFTFIREIATGGQGTVFIANVDGAEVAVKALRLHLEMSEEERRTRISFLENAMGIVKALRHPNIVQHFHTAYTVSLLPVEVPRYYITMEQCYGSLAREARKAPINGLYLQRWAHDILNGLHYLHSNRIVHRDLKGDNIFLSTQDRETCVLKIGDLGDIKHLADSFQPVSESRGTFAHMSPEMIKGTISPHFNIFHKTDIWSFGCVLIEMLTGELPKFINRMQGAPVHYKGRGCELPIMFYVGRGGRPEILESWPENVRTVINCCLDSDPQSRPSTARLLESNLIKGDPPIWDRSNADDIPAKGPTSYAISTELPAKLRNFSVIKAIAFGSYGMIYQVKTEDDIDIAMKIVLDPEEEDRPVDVTSFHQDIRALTFLRHENVVRYLSCGYMATSPLVNTSHFYIAMELCYGETLAHAVRRHEPINGRTLRKWTRNLLNGIAYLHENQIVHRTIGSFNILLSTENRETCVLKIAGLCESKRLLGDVTRSREVSVVERFLMSPEMITGTDTPGVHIGRKTDIWSFGLVLIEMLTGKAPQFIQCNEEGKKCRRCKTSQEIMFYVGSGGRPEICKSWPEGWRRMIDRCLQTDAALRPSAAELLTHMSVAGDDAFPSLEGRRLLPDSERCMIS